MPIITGRRTAMATPVNLAGSATAFAVIEDATPLDAAYWAVVTFGTTGYGDISPETTAGKLLAIYTILSTAVLLLLAGAFIVRNVITDPDAYTDAEQRQDHELNVEQVALLREVRDRLDVLTRSTA